ncbi:MAG: NAD-dependent epimerase/dehydratase family protein [Actinophytocola sp.]|uniref:NAD-dependent epimerase/dehydratase family protein n=1 Tax=Actinophytocola sp. TaxID=1872138 RepID=UPI001326D257|nr:NAD(P)-dependent oxidoreductase [Actinophytocola sp.]MPZ82814.1 NAD-dependent epimerase/dehydratase family protein [Actinophytocola sp.]
MRVILAGATGTIASELVPRLRAAGHTVLGLTRDPARLRVPDVRPVVADVMDGDGLLAALDGVTADAVIHEATAITRTPTRHRDLYATDELREVGTRNLLRAAELVGATRFLTQSLFLGYGWGDHGPVTLTEEAPFAELTGGPFDRHLRALRSNEDQVRGAGGIALRYGLFYGPEPSTFRMMAMARKRMLPVPRPSATMHLIHIADAASATVAALERGGAGEAYNVVDDEPVDMADYIDAVAAAAGARRPLRIPGWFLHATPYLHSLLSGTRIRLSNDKARRELGWAPAYPGYRQGLATLTSTSPTN